jgi:hypothetical protein
MNGLPRPQWLSIPTINELEFLTLPKISGDGGLNGWSLFNERTALI